MIGRSKHHLVLEPLERRWLLSGFWQGVDVDGDAVTVRLKGPGDLEVVTEDLGLGEQIETIWLSDTSRSSAFT